jgi:adenylate cyclase
MKLKFPKPDVGWLVPIISVALGIGLFLLDPLPLHILRNTVFDQYQRWSPRPYQDTPVRIIDIDDESLAKLGQWPWPRTRIAEIVTKLQSVGAAAIAFDVMFAEPDRTSPAAMLGVWHPSPDLRNALASLPDHDAIFAQALAHGEVILGNALQREGKPPKHFAKPYSIITLGGSPLPYLSEFKGSITSLPKLQDASAGNGVVSFNPDADGIVRRVPLILRLNDEAVPSLVSEALRVAQGEHNYFIKTGETAGEGIQEVRIGALTIPTTAQGEIWVHYSKPVAERYIPVWKILAGLVPDELLSGHILLVGTSAQGLMDLRFNPLGRIMPGVEAHAQALEQIFTGDHLFRPSWAPGLEMLVILVGGLLVGFIGISLGAVLSATATVLIFGLAGWGGWYAYSQQGLLLDPVMPGMALLITFILASMYHHMSSERRQRWIKQAFARYVSPNLVSHLVEHPEQLELGGRRQECSFIFTDLAGFTSLMEKIDPVEAVALLNNYLDEMIAIAFRNDGTLDRIVGDAVAIMFSAPVMQPDHRQRALKCALEMQRFAKHYADEINTKGIPFGQTRIGVHTGEVIVGNFGGTTIFDYRALGDPINTAARLESVNKHLGTLVCISEATLSGLPDLPVRPVGRLVLKGKTQALMVYQPIIPAEGEEATRDDVYEAAFNLLRDEKPEALEAFEALAKERPDDPLVTLHLKRLRTGEQGDRIVMASK